MAAVVLLSLLVVQELLPLVLLLLLVPLLLLLVHLCSQAFCRNCWSYLPCSRCCCCSLLVVLVVDIVQLVLPLLIQDYLQLLALGGPGS
jgi:hypothetical protein